MTNNYAIHLGNPHTLRDVAPEMFLIVPEHLKPFWRLYNNLLNKGWFDQIEDIFSKNAGGEAKEICDYAIKLIHLLKEEKNITKKQEYYQALAKLTDYLAGRLGER